MWRYRLYRLLWVALDGLFPPDCGGCGKTGVRWCADCRRQVRRPEEPLCPRCGQSKVSSHAPCSFCAHTSPVAAAVRSWALFEGPVRQALHRIKYRRDLALADALMADVLPYFRSLGWREVDALIPVPLSSQRLQQRGYNQAALLARPLALGAGVPLWPRALQRVRETRSQVGLNRTERRKNVDGAFRAAPQVRGRVVVVVDDVATSGATLDACARALLAAGARRVYGFTVARAPLDADAPRSGQRW